MSGSSDETVCPECGEPVSATASYCMHCYADLPSGETTSDIDEDPGWDDGSESTGSAADPGETATTADDAGATAEAAGTTTDDGADAATAGEDQSGLGADATDDQFLDPDGMVDNTLTVVVGIVGGIVVGLVATFLMVFMTSSGWVLPIGLLAWLGTTAYLSRKRTVQGAIAGTCYAIAVLLVAFPLIAFSPAIENTGLADRGVMFVSILVGVLVPAGIAAGIGKAVSAFTPEESTK